MIITTKILIDLQRYLGWLATFLFVYGLIHFAQHDISILDPTPFLHCQVSLLEG